MLYKRLHSGSLPVQGRPSGLPQGASQAGLPFDSWEHLQQHIAVVPPGQDVLPSFDEIMANSSVLASIVADAADAEDGTLLCLFGGPCTNFVKTRSLKAMIAHLDDHHKGDLHTNPDEKYTCRWILADGKLCGGELSTKGSLAKHILGAHLKLFTTACDVPGCNKKYSQTSALLRHREKHHPELQLTSR